MSLATPETTRLRSCRTALHAKAKSAQLSLLRAVRQGVSGGRAGRRLRPLPGQPRRGGRGRPDVRGHRGVSASERWLGELAEELRKKTYHPQPVRRVWIPKAGRQAATVGDSDDPRSRGADGGGAGLGADLRGRPAAGAVCLPTGAWSPGRGSSGVQALLNTGLYGGGRCGLERVFRQHPARRTDEIGGPAGQRPARAALIKMWLEMPVEETDERGAKRRTTRNKDEGRGTPQGAVSRRCWPICICGGSCWAGRRWATSSVCRRAHRQLCGRLRDLLSRQRRTGDGRDAGHDGEAEIDGERDEDAAVPAAGRDVRLSGVHVRAVLFAADGTWPTWGTRPSAKKVRKLSDEISRADRAAWHVAGAGGDGGSLNRKLRGWANYFCLGPVSSGLRHRESATLWHRLRRWLCRKHKVGRCGSVHGSRTSYLHEDAGPDRPRPRPTSASCGRTHESLSESRMREIRPSGSMSGEWKRSMVGYSGTGRRKGRQHARPRLNHRATPRLYLMWEARPETTIARAVSSITVVRQSQYRPIGGVLWNAVALPCCRSER